MPASNLARFMCYYAVVCDPVECKLASRRNCRDFELPFAKLLEFLTNLFAQDSNPTAWEGAKGEVVDYMRKIQEGYYNEMVKMGLKDENIHGDFLTVTENLKAGTNLSHVIELYRLNCKVDQYSGFLNIDDYATVTGEGWEKHIPPSLVEALVAALEKARNTYNGMHHDVYEYYTRYRGAACVGNLLQEVAQFMEVMSHISTACCLFAKADQKEKDGKDTDATRLRELALRNIKSATRHLQTVTLDMVKVAQASILHNDAVDTVDWQKCLMLRHQYACQKFTERKLTDYADLTSDLMRKYMNVTSEKP